MVETLLLIALCLLVVVLTLQWGVRKSIAANDPTVTGQRFDAVERSHERTERNVLDQIGKTRTELLTDTREGRTELLTVTREGRKELGEAVKAIGDTLFSRFAQMTTANDQKLERIRDAVEKKLSQLQEDNTKALESIRGTVDEKLQGTLEKRLGEAFKQVSERLETVQRGLGEMKQLAADVGDFKKVLTNVKSRGTWGEVQLQSILEDVMVPEQYAANIKPIPDSNEIVEFAIRLPGSENQDQIWLPIDAKFPQEDYIRLQEAQDRGDREACEKASKSLEKSILSFAEDIKSKDIAPPNTTHFAIMFLPTEGLYAEALRRQKIVDGTQKLRITLAGPTTLSAILNALRMGFHTLAIEKRSSEVWEILGAVKTEFSKFGGVLDKLKKELGRAQNTIEDTGVRTRVMERKLRDVERLPEADTASLLKLAEQDKESDA